uniref:CWF21 domain-containing protein n=2 Tax=Physcomitrium patens TaxID=3218 RepID=A0A7I4AK01_PHYPA
MFNGIGLSTPRGSGTNGYIQTNKFFVKSRPVRSEAKEFQTGRGAGGLKLIELEGQLVDQGYPDEEVLERVEILRKALEAAGALEVDDMDSRMNSTQSHHIAAQKEKQLESMRDALGLKNVKEGEASDRELQEQKRQERIMAREEKEQENREKQAAIEEEERRQKKELRREEKLRHREQQEEERKQRKLERKVRREQDEQERYQKGKESRELMEPRESKEKRDQEYEERDHKKKESRERRKNEDEEPHERIKDPREKRENREH